MSESKSCTSFAVPAKLRGKEEEESLQGQHQSAVFYGANLLVERKANGDAGELMAWFIDSDQFEAVSYLQRLEELLKKLSPESSQPIISCIYDPLHQRMIKGMTKENQRYA